LNPPREKEAYNHGEVNVTKYIMVTVKPNKKNINILSIFCQASEPLVVFSPPQCYNTRKKTLM
jgi:hypothetical protein